MPYTVYDLLLDVCQTIGQDPSNMEKVETISSDKLSIYFLDGSIAIVDLILPIPNNGTIH